VNTDLLLIGAGPIGIELAVRLKATREEYLTYLRAVVLQFDLPIETYQRVTSLVRRSDGAFDVTTRGRDGERVRVAGKVILAIGDMHRPRLLAVTGEDLPHVSHYFGDPHLYFRRRVLIVGGRNSAVEAAIRCVRVGAEVTLSYRGADLDDPHIKFWLLPELRALVRDRRMTFLPRTAIREIRPDAVILEPGDQRLDPDFVLLLTGYEQERTLFEEAGVTLAGPARKPRFDERTMETDVPNLYIAGTAAAGTQASSTKEFIETSHVHVDRIVAALTGANVPATPPAYELPES
jgi:thioredoxin reductase (NADPH)